MTVDFGITIEQAYTKALVRLREIDREEQEGESECVWCGGRKKAHLGDNRCNLWVCSQHFTPKRGDERKAVERAVELFEELRKLPKMEASP